MDLDIRTMIVMTSVLTLLLSVFLALASLHAEGVRGIHTWALASLSIGLGLGIAFMDVQPGQLWAITLGAAMIGLGMGLQLMGVRAFVGQHRRRRSLWLYMLVLVLVLGNLWFTQISPDATSRAVFNSCLFSLVNLASARALLVRVGPEIRTAYWFTGSVFGLLGALFLIRAVWVALLPPGSYGLYQQIPLNPVTFFLSSIALLAQTFGFMHMLHCRVTEDLHKLAARDSLTGAFNRRSLEEEFQRLRAMHLRAGEALSLVMIDIDHFKSVNDRYGHLAGDEVLRRLCDLVHHTIRGQDYFARYGGEEFCLLLPTKRASEAELLAERLRHLFEQTEIVFEDQVLRCTISLGVADSSVIGLDYQAMVGAGDQALYQAKQTGRNRVVVHAQHD